MSKQKGFNIESLYLEGFNHETDEFQTKFMLETWYDIWEEIGIKPGLIKAIVTSFGFEKTIEMFDDASTDYLQNECLTGVHSPVVEKIFELKRHDISSLLQCCRFPKRFTKCDLESKISEARSTFLASNNRVKLFDRRPLPLWFERKLRRISKMIMLKPSLSVPSIFHDIPTGAVANCKRTLPAKILKLESVTFCPKYLRIPGANKQVESEDPTCRVTFVPKNYKKLRTIAMEPIRLQYDQTCWKEYLERVLQSKKSRFSPGGRVTLNDQERNRSLALRGSTDGQLVTIDLSAASDSISAKVAECVLGPLYPTISRFRSTEMLIGDRVYPKYFYCTMGQRITFPLETLIFWVIVMAAVESYESLTHERININDIAVYGDDIIVPYCLTDTVIDFLQIAGFSVNTDKCCTNINSMCYRESCGVEAIKGYDISAIYWPRHAIRPDHTGILRLIQLHNRLYKSGFRVAADRLQSRIQAVSPVVIPLVEDDSQLGFLSEIGYTPGYKLPKSVKEVSYPIVPISRLETRPVQASDPISAAERDAYDRYCYCDYLSNGPLYADGLMELLGVSTSRQSTEILRGIAQDGSDPMIRLVTVYDWTI